MLADVNKRTFIDRFTQSVAYHGPSLISLTKDEQGDEEDSATDFLCPYTADHVAVNYFRNRLQVSMKHFRNYLVAKMSLTSIIVHVPTGELLVAETKRFFVVWAGNLYFKKVS